MCPSGQQEDVQYPPLYGTVARSVNPFPNHREPTAVSDSDSDTAFSLSVIPVATQGVPGFSVISD
jgi:hypothetical protein